MVTPEKKSWDQLITNKQLKQTEEPRKQLEFSRNEEEYDIKNQNIQQNLQNQEQKPQEKLEEKPQKSWGQLLTPSSYNDQKASEQEEEFTSDLTRNLVSNSARIGEKYLGRFGDMAEVGKALLDKVPESSGLVGAAIKSFIGPEAWHRLIYGNQQNEKNPAFKIPTSSDFKKITEGLTGDYTKPRNKTEKGFQEFSEDVGSTISGRNITPRQIAINNLSIPAVANGVKQTVEHLGFGEDKAMMAKMAVWLPLSLMGNVNGRNYASQQVREARQSFPNFLQASPINIQNRVNNVSQHMPRGDPATNVAWEAIRGIEDDIIRGRLSINELATRYDAINRLKNSRSLFELNSENRRLAAANIDRVRHIIRDEIRDVGQNYPGAVQQLEHGMQSLAVIHQSNRMTNWIHRILTGPYAKLIAGPAMTLFGGAAVGAYHHPLLSLGTSAAVAGGYKVGQVALRMWNDPRLASYYWNAISAANQQNVPAFITNYKKLNEALEKKEKSRGTSNKKKNEG